MAKIFWKGVGAGLLGGLAGAYAMNQFQALVKVVSSPEGGSTKGSGDDATVKTAKAISEKLFKHDLATDQKQWAGPVVHYSTGAVAGAIYGALAESVPAVSWGGGTLYGTAVWLGGDEIAVPVFGLSGPPTETPLSGHAIALSAHLVFGAVVFAVRKILLKS